MRLKADALWSLSSDNRAQFVLARPSTRQLQACYISAGHNQQHRSGGHNERNGQLKSALLFQGQGKGEPGQTSAVAALADLLQMSEESRRM
jgi:hypothetical protein